VLRDHPGEMGLTSGVGMANTKHVAGVWSTTPADPHPPDDDRLARALPPPVPIVEEHAGPARVAAYSVVHGRDGAPEWGLLVCDVEGGRCYARLDDADALAAAECEELVGRDLALRAEHVSGSRGDGVRHLVVR
jgi:acetyl-CoA C-acetyltransferase